MAEYRPTIPVPQVRPGGATVFSGVLAFLLIAAPVIASANPLETQYQGITEELESCLFDIDPAAAEPVNSVYPCVLPAMEICIESDVDDYADCVNVLAEQVAQWSLGMSGTVSESAVQSANQTIRLECNELETEEDLRAQCRLIGNIAHADELISIAAGRAK